MSVSERVDVRVKKAKLDRIARAAALSGETTSEFVRDAAEERAEQVLREHEARTRVPEGFFDALQSALDAPAAPNPGLTAAFDRLREMTGE
jgi:uncharacterized protein (DUF1778 family)